MHRTQVLLEEELHQTLREVAAAEGRSAASIVREAVRLYLEARHFDDDPIRELIGAFEGPSDSASQHDRGLYDDSMT